MYKMINDMGQLLRTGKTIEDIEQQLERRHGPNRLYIMNMEGWTFQKCREYSKEMVATMIVVASGAKKMHEGMIRNVIDELYDKQYFEGDQISNLPYTNSREIVGDRVKYIAGQDYEAEMRKFRKWLKK